MFSAVFFGSLLTVLPAGWLADRIGTRYLIISSLLLRVIATVATPSAAVHFGPWAVWIARFLIGMGQVRFLKVEDR